MERDFHGWRIVRTLAVAQTISWGILYYALTVLMLPTQRDLGFSTATLTGAFSLALAVTGIAAVPIGRWVDRRARPELAVHAKSTSGGWSGAAATVRQAASSRSRANRNASSGTSPWLPRRSTSVNIDGCRTRLEIPSSASCRSPTTRSPAARPWLASR